MLELEFRPMRVEDLDRVYEIETASFKNCPWPKLAYKREITENRLSDYCVCLYDGRIVAFAGMWSIYEESELTKIATDTSMRRMGIGKRLLLWKKRMKRYKKITMNFGVVLLMLEWNLQKREKLCRKH